MAETVFTARALTSTYTSGEVQVLVLQGVDLEVWAWMHGLILFWLQWLILLRMCRRCDR
jgi:hypothetical protein